MKKLLYNIWLRILDIFGDIRVSIYPFWMLYEPEYFAVTGDKIYEALKIAKPGDVLLHCFDAFLCTKFINTDAGRAMSHGGLYIGDNKVIHSTIEGVNQTTFIDFAEADRLCILRPRKGARQAVAMAKKMLKNGVKYDILFKKNKTKTLTEPVYCFELCAECYPKLDIPLKKKKMFFGLFTRKEPMYLPDSFYDSPDFEVVFEYNPKYGINYVKKGI